MYKNIILNYAKNLTKNDLYNFSKNNNLNIESQDIDTVYNYIKNNYKIILDDPLKHINLIKEKVSINTYNVLLNYYKKYKNFI